MFAGITLCYYIFYIPGAEHQKRFNALCGKLLDAGTGKVVHGTGKAKICNGSCLEKTGS